MSGVNIRVNANTRPAQAELGRLNRSLGNLEAQASKIQKTFRNVGLAISGAFAATQFTRAFNNASDSITNLNNRLALVVGKGAAAEKTLNALFEVASDTRSSIDQSAETFQRFGLALKDAGKNSDDFLKITKLVNQAAILSSTGPESAKAAIIQLGQGLASGQLRGQELNSVLEQTPRLAKAIADGMGIPFGNLRQAAEDGLLTTQAVFDAVISQAKTLGDEFGLMNATVGDLTTVMGNEFTRALAKIDDVIGFSGRAKESIIALTQAFRFVGKNIDRWALNAEIAFLIFKSQVKDLAASVKDALMDLFSTSFDADKFVENLLSSYTKAKTQLQKLIGSDTVKAKLEIVTEKFDYVKSLIPNETEIIAALTTFKDNVIKVFKSLWERIVGKSLWTGIFDPAHEEGGAAAIGNLSYLKGKIDPVVNTFKVWGLQLQGVFVKLMGAVTGKWDELTSYVETNGFVLPETTFTALETSFNTAVASMTTTYDNFLAKVKETDAFKKAASVAGEVDQTLKISETVGGAVNSVKDSINDFDAAAFKANVKAALDKAQPDIDSWKAAFFKTPLVVGVVELSESLKLDAQQFSNAFAKSLRDQEGTLGIIISVAFSAAISKAFRKKSITFAIGGAWLYAASTLGNNAQFLDSIKETAKAYTDLLVYSLTGEGDFVGKLASGIVNLFVAAGEGISESLLGEGFLSDLATPFISALVAAGAAAVISKKLRDKMKVVGLTMAKDIISKGFQALMFSKFGTVFLDMATSPEVSKKMTSAGTTLGRTLQKGLIIGVTVGLAIALEEAVKRGLGGAIDKAIGFFRGETSAEQAERRVEGESGQSLAEQIDNGTINLELLDDTTLKSIADSLSKTEESVFDFADGTLDKLLNRSSLEIAIDKLTDVMDDRGIGYAAPIKRAAGGFVSGAGTPTSDSIPAMLSNGEYVIKASTVSKLGKSKLDLLNQGILPQFAGGGLVGRAQQEIKDSFGRGDTQTAMQLISAVERLGKLDEVIEGLDETIQEQIAQEQAAGTGGTTAIQDSAQASADGFVNFFASSLSESIKSGDFSSFFDGLLDNFTSSIVDNFVSGFTDSLFKDLDLSSLFSGAGSLGSSTGGLGGLTSLFGGGASGGGLSGLLSMGMGFFGFSQGGTVPSTAYSQAGKDSVPAMLMPGEVVLSKNDVRNMDSGRSSSQQSFNINVQGDVSRQTRQEIVKMIPQITSGVNMTNKESNFKR